jgi:hypothetical protein
MEATSRGTWVIGALAALLVAALLTAAAIGAAPGRAATATAKAAGGGGKVHLTLSGIGDARFGMTFARIRRAVGSRFRCTAGNPCRCARNTGRPNVTFVFGADRRLGLIVADLVPGGARAVTGRGVALGDSEQKLRRLYPKARRIDDTPRYRWTRNYRGYIFDFANGPLSSIVAGYKSLLLSDEFCG